jgi:glycosyltransferase involved in cell wall biosynthesis
LGTAHAERFTFAVIGHNEAATLAGVLEQAFAAARPGDAVWFVDSRSTDDSRAIAAQLGAGVVPAGLGKGRAVAAALARCRDGRLCLLDADVQRCQANLAAALRDAAVATGADMVVGEVDAGRKRRSVTPALYRPLAAALFPEAPALERPLSGFRVLRAGLDVGRVPAGYGVEAHLNVHLAATGATIAPHELGFHRGPLRGYANVAALAEGVVEALLDAAVAHGRLDAGARPAWEAWADEVLEVVRTQPGEHDDDSDYLRRLRRAAARPLPPARA